MDRYAIVLGKPTPPQVFSAEYLGEFQHVCIIRRISDKRLTPPLKFSLYSISEQVIDQTLSEIILDICGEYRVLLLLNILNREILVSLQNPDRIFRMWVHKIEEEQMYDQMAYRSRITGYHRINENINVEFLPR